MFINKRKINGYFKSIGLQTFYGEKIISFYISHRIDIKKMLKWLINKCPEDTHIRCENIEGSAHYE